MPSIDRPRIAHLLGAPYDDAMGNGPARRPEETPVFLKEQKEVLSEPSRKLYVETASKFLSEHGWNVDAPEVSFPRRAKAARRPLAVAKRARKKAR